MDWNAIGAIGEILGAVAVAATLGYLAVQTRYSVAATQANTRQAILEVDQQLIANLMLDPAIDVIRFKRDLSDDEKVKLYYFLILFVRIRESNWLQFHSGSLDRETWENSRALIPAVMNNPNGRSWWRNYGKAVGIYSKDFVSEVDELLEQTPVIEQSRALSAFDGE